MASGAVVEKTADELLKELQELQRQHREISERLRDPRGIRRGGAAVTGGTRQTGPGLRQRGHVRPPVLENEEQPAQKRRLLSTLVKADGAEVKLEQRIASNAKDETAAEATENRREPRATNDQASGGLRRDANSRIRKPDYNMPPPEPLPRVFPKDENPSLVKRNKRMLGQLLGTLEKFREEDKQLSSTQAFMRRSDSLRRAEEKAREESEKLKQQEAELITEKRRRDLTLRARVAAKADEKRLELLFLDWTEHHKKLSNFLRTKAQPPIYYMPAKPLVEDATAIEQRKEKELDEWKSARRAELSEYRKKLEEQYLSNVEAEMERWQNARKVRRNAPVGDAASAETMDKELETHRLEHGPKPRRIPGSENIDEEDVDDIVAEDELTMDDVMLGEAGVRFEGGDVARVSEIENGNAKG
ncbi:protein-protein interaction regulator family protein [Carex rostrata]